MSILISDSPQYASPSIDKHEAATTAPAPITPEIATAIVESHVPSNKFETIQDPGSEKWVQGIAQVPIARDKFPEKRSETTQSFYKNNKQIIHISTTKSCTIILFVQNINNVVEGSVILTEREEGIEVEYGKNERTPNKGVGERMLSTVLDNYYTFGLPKSIHNLYGEVVSSNGAFNFASYIYVS